MKKNKRISWKHTKDELFHEGLYLNNVVFEIHDGLGIFILYNYIGINMDCLSFETLEDAKKGAEEWLNGEYPKNAMNEEEAIKKMNDVFSTVIQVLDNIKFE